jgi:hypothetical protein
MYSLWSLPAIALAVPTYAAWRIKQSGRRKLPDNIPSVPQPSFDVTAAPDSSAGQTRLMRWISVREFMRVLEECSDLVVIDLRANSERVPFPIPTALALLVTPNELDAVLEWLPTDRSAAFYGASDLSIFAIKTSLRLEGSAPLYVLKGDLSLAEVA